MKKLKKLIFLVILICTFLTFNLKCYAGYRFLEVEYEEENGLLDVLFNFSYVTIILLYIFIQIILMIKDKKNNLFKNNLKIYLITNTLISIFVILFIYLINSIIDLILSIEILIDINKGLKIISIVINTLILILSIFFSRKLLKNNIENSKLFHNKKNLAITIILLVVLLGINIFIKNTPQAHIIRREWSFGETIDITYYNIKLYKGKTFDISYNPLLVKDIDDEGILLEYYEYNPNSTNSSSDENINNNALNVGYFNSNNWEQKTEIVQHALNLGPLQSNNWKQKIEIVQQKIKWNVYYSYKISTDPTMAIDGGYNYYVKFTK